MSAIAEVEVVSSAGKAETPILSWVFEKFACAVAGKGAGFGMDHVLALVGIRDSSPEVRMRLENIRQGIKAILVGVEQISRQIDDLLRPLKLTAQEIRKEIQEGRIHPAVNLIEGHYGTAGSVLEGRPDPVAITSLGDGVVTRLRDPLLEIDTKTFASNVIGLWDIHGQVVKIATAVATSTSTKPLLQGWTDYVLAKSRGHVLNNALTIYLTLESYFQELLAAQFKGINLVTSAKCYAMTEADAQRIAEAYLAEVAPYLTAQADLFVKCANEISLAMFTDTGWLYSPGPTRAADDIRTITRRANLVRAVVRAAVGKGPAIGGIYGTVIGRNVEQEQAASRTFAPKGYAASAGEALGRLEAAGNAPIEWETSRDNNYATLREKAKSAFQAFHYDWPWPATLPEAGKPIDPSFDGGLTPQWYSVDTLEKLDQPRPDQPKVLAADFCEMRFMRGAIFANPADADRALVSTPPGTGTTNNNVNRVGYRNDEKHGIHAMRADETFQRILAQGALEGHMNYHGPQGGPIGFTLEFPLFRYQGSGETLRFAVELLMKLELVRDVLPHRSHPKYARMLMSPRGKFWLTRTRAGVPRTIDLYNTDVSGLSLWGQGSYVSLQNSRPDFTADVVLESTGGAEDLYSLVLELCVINTLEGGHDPVHGRHAQGRITYSLKGFRMMWK